MSTNKFLLLFSLNLCLVFLLRNLNQRDSLPDLSFSPHRLLSPQSYMNTSCSNVNLDGYLATVSTQSSVQDTYNMLLKSRNGENKLKTLIQNKTSISTNDAQTYALSLLTAAIPIAIVFIFSVISSLVYCSCLCCKCCPWKCCCNCCKKTSTIKRSDLTWPAIIALIMGLGVIGSAVAGLIFNEKFTIGYNQVQCSAATSLYNFITGVNTTSNNITYIFLGVNGANTQLDTIINDFNQTINSLNDNFQDTQWIDDDETQLQNQIQYIYTNNKNSQVTSPDPSSPDNSTQVQPPYFTTLGPNDQSLTVTNKLTLELQASTNLVAQGLQSIKNSSTNLISQSGSVFSSLTSGQSQLNDFSQSASDYDTTASNTTNSGQMIFSIIYYVIIAILSFAMLCALGGFLGCCCSTLCHMPKCRFCTHLSWCGLIWFSMFIFLISIVLIPASIFFMESCEIVTDAFTSSSEMKSFLSAIIGDTDSDRLDVCLFQDGDINKLFNMSDALSNINAVTQSFNNFTNETLNGSYVIQNESAYVNQILEFVVDPIGIGANDYSSPSYVLEDLNLWSDYSLSSSEQAAHCNVSQDRFVFNYSQCAAYTTHFSTSGAFNQDFTNKICINVGDLGTSTSNIAARYGTSFDSCTPVSGNTVGTTVKSIYSAEVRQLDLYQADVITTFTQILNDYQSYDTLNNEYQYNLSALSNRTMNGLKTSINGILNLVSNNQTGLIAGLNCTFLRRDADDMVNSLCVVFVPAFYQLMILILLCGGFTFFMSIALMRNALMVKKNFDQANGGPGYEDPNARGAVDKYAIN